MLGGCKLCEERKDLSLSHSLPASAFNCIFSRPLASGRAVSVTHDAMTPNKYSSDSWDVYLLCRDCEKHLNEAYDSYGIGVFKGEQCMAKRNDFGVTFSGIDRQRLRMFALSLLWRISVSTHDSYSNIDLPHEWERQLHTALKSRACVRSSVFTVGVYRLRDSHGISSFSMNDLRSLVLAPFARDFQVCISICFVLFGFLIEIFLPRLPSKGMRTNGALVGMSPVFLAPYQEVAAFPELLALLKAGIEKHEAGLSRFS